MDNGAAFPYKVGMKEQIYLDYNATAPLRPAAYEALTNALKAPLNASSVHGYGRKARKIVEESRESIAELVRVPPGQIIFNSGATEGNNTVLRHFDDQKIAMSAIEHPSVLEAAKDALIIPVTTDGTIDLNALEELLASEKPALLSVMMVNNETGAIQPIAEAVALAKKYGALTHSDATQAVGRIPVDITALGMDFMTLSSHKIGGPQGVGALILGLCGDTPILLHGGGQEKKARAGTENVAAIAGFGAAAKDALDRIEDYKELSKLRDRLESGITKGVVIHCANTARTSNTSMFSLPGASSETLMMALDLEGIAVSNGSACSSGTVHASHVLQAMNVPEDQASSAIRVSLGWNSKEEDIDSFLQAWEKITARL